MRYPYVGTTLVQLQHAALHHIQAELPQLLGGGTPAVMVQVRLACITFHLLHYIQATCDKCVRV